MMQDSINSGPQFPEGAPDAEAVAVGPGLPAYADEHAVGVPMTAADRNCVFSILSVPSL